MLDQFDIFTVFITGVQLFIKESSIFLSILNDGNDNSVYFMVIYSYEEENSLIVYVVFLRHCSTQQLCLTISSTFIVLLQTVMEYVMAPQGRFVRDFSP